ncbi:trehalose-phosphatase [Frateuria sp. STR12]|uniref:trehalose-phosphatase n=1 Tax=Frateuria hangzhouensis TaxID=2995589 RepID=UPI002260BF99|nr:trehalose-phosphatase [Frateuria sp. STR12]MCX7514061.1 trehalose-phosphatase [Frateuria sp. STR12]
MSSPEPVRVNAPLPAPPLPVAGSRWALFLDVDGCLLEFVDDPDAVFVPPGLKALLQTLHDRLDGALALVSGRGVDSLDRLFGAPAWALAGLHGYELRHADGLVRRITVDPADQARMRAAVQALAARLDGVQLEDKQHAMALHCRRAPDRLPALREAAEAVAAGLHGYELQPGNLVMEFKPAGMDKGRVVEELMQRPPFTGRTPVYLGDDLTDEHAFAAVNRAGGLSVRVGWREPTAARFTLPSPAAVQAWLDRVRDAFDHGPDNAKGVSIDADNGGGQPPTRQR